jgi:peroxiredoxin
MFNARRVAQAGLGAACLILMLSLLVLVSGASQAGSDQGLPGSVAADFRARDLDQNLVALADIKGDVTVMYFTDRDNPLLRQIAPRLAMFNEKFAGQNVKLVAVYSDSDGRDAATVVRIDAARLGLNVQTLLDASGDLVRKYRVQETPVFFVIDAEGMIRYRGGFDGENAINPQIAAGVSCEAAVENLLSAVPASHVIRAP